MKAGGPSLSEEEMKQRKTKAVMSWLVCLSTSHLLPLALWCSMMAGMAMHLTDPAAFSFLQCHFCLRASILFFTLKR